LLLAANRRSDAATRVKLAFSLAAAAGRGQGLRTTQAGNAKRRWLRAADARGKIVIVGGGAAGFAAAAAHERRYSSSVSVDGA